MGDDQFIQICKLFVVPLFYLDAHPYLILWCHLLLTVLVMAHGSLEEVLPSAIMLGILGQALQDVNDARILIPFLAITCIDRLFSYRYEELDHKNFGARVTLIVTKLCAYACMLVSHVFDPLKQTTRAVEFQFLFFFFFIVYFIIDIGKQRIK